MPRSEKEPKDSKKIGRREVLKKLGLGTAAIIGGGVIGWGLHDQLTESKSESQKTDLTSSNNPRESANSTQESAEFNFQSAEKKDNQWLLHNPDGEPVNLQLIDGFIPDSNLVTAPEQPLPLDPAVFADFQASLNDPNNPLAGYSYGENDQSDNPDYKMTLQAPLYSWTVLTGEETEVPGIGHLKANPGGAVAIVIMNISDKVIEWGTNQPLVMLKHGFKGTGRIWDGNKVVETERGISSHYVNRLEQGVTLPGESGFIGQCDKPENCNNIKVVSVIYRQWGNHPDGTPRFQFQLLRAEEVNK